jgi:hypothetical protein
MALVIQFEKNEKNNPKVHDATHAAYFSFIGPKDKRYFVLETYGSENREFPGKVSQSIQLDEEGAVQLIRILKSEFPNIG